MTLTKVSFSDPHPVCPDCLEQYWYVQDEKAVASVALVWDEFDEEEKWSFYLDGDSTSVESAEEAEEELIHRFGPITEQVEMTCAQGIERYPWVGHGEEG